MMTMAASVKTMETMLGAEKNYLLNLQKPFTKNIEICMQRTLRMYLRSVKIRGLFIF